MKKSYIQPKTTSVNIKCQTIIAATLTGTGAKISNTAAGGDAESRSALDWDDED